METTISNNQKNVGALVHLSTFSKFFFPFGNFIAPLLLWTFNKEQNFIDEHGKEAINFQLSIFIYSLVIGFICLPFVLIFAGDFIALANSLDHSVDYLSFSDLKNFSGYVIGLLIAAVLLFALFVFELYAVISATMQASKGYTYKYPLSISFIKTTTNPTPEEDAETNQSKNEHIS
jgi:hypothetical protein